MRGMYVIQKNLNWHQKRLNLFWCLSLLCLSSCSQLEQKATIKNDEENVIATSSPNDQVANSVLDEIKNTESDTKSDTKSVPVKKNYVDKIGETITSIAKGLENPNGKKQELTTFAQGEKIVYTLSPTPAKDSPFRNATDDYGLSGITATHLYAVDFNGDGYTDLVTLPDYYSKPDWFLFNPELKKFQRVEVDPMPEIVRASYLAFFDFDRDGRMDLITGTLNQKSSMRPVPWRVFLNVGDQKRAKFYEIKNVFPAADAASGIVFLDYDQDGMIDLFQPNWFSFDGKNTPRPDILWRGEKLFTTGIEFSNQSGFLQDEHRFIRADKQYINATPSFGASICDVDRNGRTDILTTSSNGFNNKLWSFTKETLGGTELELFRDIGEASGYASDEVGDKLLRGGGNNFFSLCFDYNNDSLPDVLIGSLNKETDPETQDRSSVLSGSTRGYPPRFIRSEFYRQTNNEKYIEGDRRGVLIDYNNDGLIDFFVDNAGFPPDSRAVFFEQQKDHAYIDKSVGFGLDIVNPSGTVSIDLNRDGKMDLISGQTKLRTGQYLEGKTQIYVFENTVQNSNKSLRLFFKSDESNPHAIGASVEVITNKRKFWRIVEYVSGSLPSQNEEGIHFGLGLDTVKEINVTWPLLKNGKTLVRKYKINQQLLKQKNYRLTLHENGSVL